MDKNFPEITKQSRKPTRNPDLVEAKNESQCPFPPASLELLSMYGNRMKHLNGKKLNEQHQDQGAAYNSSTSGKELSTAEVMKIARAKFMCSFSSQNSDDISKLIHMFNSDHSSLSCEVSEQVELAVLLLASAKKVSDQQFDRAMKFLSMCEHSASPTGNPVQRVIYYFAEALQKRISRETGINSLEGQEGNKSDLDEGITSLQPYLVACWQEIPFALVSEATGIQAILDGMASAKRIHLVDFEIRSGMQWTLLMQALAIRHECPVEILKITAVAVGTTSKRMIEETGRRLSWFAETMSLPFSFKLVFVGDIGDFKADFLGLEDGEAIAVYSSFLLKKLIARPDHLEALIRVIKSLRPIVMVVTEVEASTNSPDFMDQFIETLSLYSAAFDCLEACMHRCNPNRLGMEAEYLRQGIQNVLSFEGEERKNRHMRIDEWRGLFKGFGMVETELSMFALCQANLVVKKFACGSSCTLNMDGKCLIVGWKGTPALSISAWKFNLEEE